jgi:predicted negative regulator of RcsB-dependent stress response
VDEYLSEKEQVEQIRAWLKDNLAWIVGGLVIGIGGISGFNYLQARKLSMAEAAAVEYSTLRSALEAGSVEAAQGHLQTLVADYKGTPYLDQARLAMASAALEAGDPDTAEVYLRAALESTSDPDLRRVIRLRLARVLIATDRADDAIETLALRDAGVFAGQYHALRGDVFAARGETSAAREEYEAALEADRAESIDTATLERKLAALPAEASDAS